MIRVQRPGTPPRILKTKGKAKRRVHSSAYTRRSKDYDTGRATFDFDRKIYAHRSVKDALVKAGKGKCWFCDSDVKHIAHGDVEHYRPKAGYRQSEEDKELKKPGYYWLAYEWENLLFSCQMCNGHKANSFPLENPDERAVSHKDDVRKERPLFIDPATEDPEEHIGFREEVAYPVGNSKRGHATIEGLGLNRDALLERRKHRYQLLKRLADLANTTDLSETEEAREARLYLQRELRDEAEYAAMIRCAARVDFQKYTEQNLENRNES